MKMNGRHKMAGFNMVELIVVVAIGLVVMAVGVPYLLTGLRQYHLTSSAVGVANFFQRCRYDAVRLNTNVTCRWVPRGTGWTLFIDENNNGVPDPTEPTFFFPNDLQLNLGAAPGPASTGYAGAAVPDAAAGIIFTPRGAVANLGGAPAFILTMGYGGGPNSTSYRAVTISVMGKSKVWGATQGTNWWNEI